MVLSDMSNSMVGPEDPSHAPLIMFIHGLGGDPKDTWKAPGALSLPDLVKKRYPVACDSLRYSTSIGRLPLFSKKSSPIQLLAAGLRTHIENTHRGRADIVLVGHSLGGLVARWYVLTEIKKNHDLRVRHLVLYATPNNGAALASVGKMLSWNHYHLRQLCKDSDLLNILNEDWKTFDVASRVSTTFVVGEQDSVVTADSASLYPGNPAVQVVLGCGHRDLVKPRGNAHLSLLILSNVIEATLPFSPGASAQKVNEAAQLLQASRTAYSESNYVIAYQTIKSAYVLDPASIDISRQYVRVAQNDHSSVRSFLKDSPNVANREDLRCHEGELLLRERKYAEAAAVLSSIGDRSIYNVEYLTGSALQLLHGQSHDILHAIYARDHFRRAARLFPDHWWVTVNLFLIETVLARADPNNPMSHQIHRRLDIESQLERAITSEPRLFSARFYRLIIRDLSAFSDTARKDTSVFAASTLNIPKNFPVSFLARLEMIFADNPDELVIYRDTFLRALVGSDAGN